MAISVWSVRRVFLLNWLLKIVCCLLRSSKHQYKFYTHALCLYYTVRIRGKKITQIIREIPRYRIDDIPIECNSSMLFGLNSCMQCWNLHSIWYVHKIVFIALLCDAHIHAYIKYCKSLNMKALKCHTKSQCAHIPFASGPYLHCRIHKEFGLP